MSGAAMNWVMTAGASRCASSNQLLVLLRIAYHTDQHGRGCYAAQQTIADETHLSRATVKRSIDDLKGLGLIVPGDPERAAHIRPDRRPEVWDVPIEPSRTAGGHRDPSLPTGGQADPPEGIINGLTGGQTISPRGVTVTPKPVREEPVKEESSLLPPQRIIRNAGITLGEDDEKRFIEWINRDTRKGTPWWRTVAKNGDLPGLVAEWREAATPGKPPNGLPPWCGQCGDGGTAARFNVKLRTLDGLGGSAICPRCHPLAVGEPPQPAPRGHVPYQNPADHSVYFGAIS